MEELFKKCVPVTIKCSDRDERHISIGITILLNVVTTPVHKKELLVRLTEEGDPFFLYTLALGEDDFQGLKSQQGLLVDFSAFPQKFIDLLELCLEEVGKESPKFLLQFCTDKTSSILNIVETNPFRHLNHLSLKFVPASDTYLRKYMAECLLTFKEENERLSEHFTVTKTDLSAQLAQCKEALNKRSLELDRLKSEWSSQVSSLSNEHSASLTAERERALQAQTEAQSRFEVERKEMERTHSAKLESVESRLQELDTSNKELTDHKYRSEAAIRELKNKLKTTEEECTTLREELQQLRRDNSSLDAGSHEQEKTISQLRTRVAVLEQELQDKEQVISRTTELLEASGEQKRSCEIALEQKQRQVTKLDVAFKSASQEVMKGNEIIQKLQSELRSVKSKLKLKNMVTTQQEKLLGEKEMEMERHKHELHSLNETLAKKQDELKKMEESLEETKAKLDESREQLKTNENVITWLNKQMNEQMLGRGPPRLMTGVPPSVDTLSTIRPSPVVTHTQSHPHPITGTAGSLGLYAQYRPQYSSTPTSSTTTSGPGPHPPPVTRPSLSSSQLGQRQVLGSISNQENVQLHHIPNKAHHGHQQQQQHHQQQQQVLFKGPNKKTSGIPVPSPLSAHSLSANNSGRSIGTAGTPTNKTGDPSPKSKPEGEPWLDPKYLHQEQPSPPISSTSAGTRVIYHNDLINTHPSVTPGLLQKPLHAQFTGGLRQTPPTGPHPPIASSTTARPANHPLLSAYFPKTTHE